jgi:predicted GIY-YIG superfamily endonuclease
MHYVYIIKSLKNQSLYAGATSDLRKRLTKHNKGGSPYTKKNKPYKLLWYSSFLSKKKALEFEKYLKTGSGIAFTRKRFI